MPITKLRGDLAVVKVDGVASRMASKIIIQAAVAPAHERTSVFWGVVQMAGNGAIHTVDGSGDNAPSILDCPGFYLGCRVLFLQRFHHQGAAPHLENEEVLVHDFDILAAVDAKGALRPAWGYSLIDSPRQDGAPRPAFEGSQILLVDGQKDYAERPLSSGTVVTTAPDYRYKGEEKNITGRIAEFWGVASPPFSPGDEVVFRRFAGWRAFIDEKTRDDNLMLVPNRDVLAVLAPGAEFVCADDSKKEGVLR